MNDPHVFPICRATGSVNTVELARLTTRAETLAECHQVAASLERGQANAAAVRRVLTGRLEDAWLQVEACREGALLEAASELEEAVRPVTSDAASSGAACPLPPSAPLPDDGFLRGVARGLDMAVRALGTPRPWEREKDEPPTLRVVE